MNESATVGIIYKATCIPTGLVYIGQTTQHLKERKQQHFQSAHKPRTRFSTAIKQWGSSAFEWNVIDKANTIEELNNKEERWIEYYNSTNENRGYNHTKGGAWDSTERERKITEKRVKREIQERRERDNDKWGEYYWRKKELRLEKESLLFDALCPPILLLFICGAIYLGVETGFFIEVFNFLFHLVQLIVLLCVIFLPVWFVASSR